MKQDENHTDDEMKPNDLSSIHDSSVINCMSTFESADYHLTSECNQSKPNTSSPMMSSQSDPRYASAHRINIPTESQRVIIFNNFHSIQHFGFNFFKFVLLLFILFLSHTKKKQMDKVHTENHIGNNTISEQTNKKGNVTKKPTLNKINVNNKTSDVVSNQSLNSNNNMISNDLSISDTTINPVSDSDSLNNNIGIEMNEQYQHDADIQQNVAGIQKALIAANNVNSTVSKSINPSAASYQPKGIIAYDSVNSKSLSNISNGK